MFEPGQRVINKANVDMVGTVISYSCWRTRKRGNIHLVEVLWDGSNEISQLLNPRIMKYKDFKEMINRKYE